MSVIDGLGIRILLDDVLEATEPGLPVFLRLHSDSLTEGTAAAEYREYGFQVAKVSSGFADIEIIPAASATPMSMTDIGLNNTALFFGAHNFVVSHTFVEKMMEMLGVSEGYEVWRHKKVIGLLYNQRMFSIESVVPEVAGSVIIKWKITANATDRATQARHNK